MELSMQEGIGSAAEKSNDRVIQLEQHAKAVDKRLNKIDKKLDKLLEQGRPQSEDLENSLSLRH